MRWNQENEWQLRADLCGTVDNMFIAGADESLYISYEGQTEAKLVFCADDQCEFYQRPGVINVADHEKNDSIIIDNPVSDSKTSLLILILVVDNNYVQSVSRSQQYL